jgi:hypothetical protein
VRFRTSFALKTYRQPPRSVILFSLVLPLGQDMAFLNFDSEWFQCYSKAVSTEDLRLRRIYVNDALKMINEALSRQDLEENEREAISVAAHELHLIEGERLDIDIKSSARPAGR